MADALAGVYKSLKNACSALTRMRMCGLTLVKWLTWKWRWVSRGLIIPYLFTSQHQTFDCTRTVIDLELGTTDSLFLVIKFYLALRVISWIGNITCYLHIFIFFSCALYISKSISTTVWWFCKLWHFLCMSIIRVCWRVTQLIKRTNFL